jgi:hypothetical protein
MKRETIVHSNRCQLRIISSEDFAAMHSFTSAGHKSDLDHRARTDEIDLDRARTDQPQDILLECRIPQRLAIFERGRRAVDRSPKMDEGSFPGCTSVI